MTKREIKKQINGIFKELDLDKIHVLSATTTQDYCIRRLQEILITHKDVTDNKLMIEFILLYMIHGRIEVLKKVEQNRIKCDEVPF